MRKPWLWICLLLFSSCTKWRFQQFEKKFQLQYQALYQQKTDFQIITPEILSARQQFIDTQIKALQTFPPARLSATQNKAWRSYEQTLDQLFAELENLQRDPSLYNPVGHWKTVLAKSKPPLDTRLRRISQQMQDANAYFSAAKANLRAPIASRIELAIQKQLLAIKFLNTELPDSIALSSLSTDDRDTLMLRTYDTKIAVKDYLAFCRSLLFEQHDTAFYSKHAPAPR